MPRPGTNTPMLLARSRHASMRSLERYARPGRWPATSRPPIPLPAGADPDHRGQHRERRRWRSAGGRRTHRRRGVGTRRVPGRVSVAGCAARGQPADLAAAARLGREHGRRPAHHRADRVRLGRGAPAPVRHPRRRVRHQLRRGPGPVSATPGRSGWAGWGCGWVSGSSMSTTSSTAGGSICASRRSWLPNPAGCIRAAPQGGEPAHPRAGTDRGRSSTPPSRTWCSPRRYAPPRSWASCWTPIPTPSRPPWVWIATSSPRCCRCSGWSVSTAEGSTGPWPTSPPQQRRSRHEGHRSGCCARQPESDTPTVLREVLVLDRDGLGIDTVGLQLDEAKELLAGVQDIVVDAQVAVAVAAQVGCPHCGAARRHKDTGQVVVRSLFGTLRVPSPRWWHCGCQPHPTRTFRPVAELLPERTTPELAYLQARFAAQASYQVAAILLAEVLPLGRTLHAATVRRHTHAVAQRE